MVIIMSILARQKCQKMAKFWMSQVAQSVPASISTTDYSNKGDLPKLLD